MKLSRLLAATLAVVVFASVALVAQNVSTTGPSMAAAAQKLLASLTADQRAKAAFPYDDPERLKWAFVPLQDRDKKPTRKGLRIEEMTATQREAALAMLQTGTSATGYAAATTIMSLESILRDLENNGAMVRNPGWYFVSVFGTPGNTGKWGWRIEGHHLSLNYSVENGQVASATPCFFGANPATVMVGDRKGTRAIPDVDDLAKELFTSLDPDQRTLAEQVKHFGEPNAPKPAADPGPPAGISAARLNETQRGTLTKLLKAYTSRLPDEIGQAELARITAAGHGKIYFAFSGATEQGKERSYRLQGPTFVAEFLNRQADSARNPANHIHSAWRHLPKDFGLAAD